MREERRIGRGVRGGEDRLRKVEREGGEGVKGRGILGRKGNGRRRRKERRRRIYER